MITIAVTSFKEALRKKIILLVGIITIIYLVIYSLITFFVVQDINKQSTGNSITTFMIVSQIVSVLGFYFSSMLVAFLAIMSSISSISSEVESGIIHSIITRPIRRIEYVLGKYLGLAVLLVAYSVFIYLSVIAICIAVKLPFITNLGIMPLAKGLLFFILEPLAILSLSIFGSCTFRTLTNGIFVISIYILGLIGGIMEQIGPLFNNNSLLKWGILSSLISPFDVIYRQMLQSVFGNVGLTNPLFGSSPISGTSPSKWMIIYIFVYIIGLLLWAVRKFSRKDIP